MLSSFSPPILAAVPDLSSMADKKISTINLEVDLDCSCCFKKITETLENYPEIQTWILNREKKTVTISGPFDPEKLMKCICCKAGKYIKSYEIVKLKPAKPKPNPRSDAKTQTEPEPKPKPVCCRQCYEGQRGGPCWHGLAPHPCPAPICVCLCIEGYEAGPYSSHYSPPCGCRGEESTCRTM